MLRRARGKPGNKVNTHICYGGGMGPLAGHHGRPQTCYTKDLQPFVMELQARGKNMESAPVAGLLLLSAVILTFALRSQRKWRGEGGAVTVLFFFSGFPALIYQIVWQRALFVIYGVNVQSVAVVVSAFMLGLGLGSLAGGRMSAIFPRRGIPISG